MLRRLLKKVRFYYNLERDWRKMHTTMKEATERITALEAKATKVFAEVTALKTAFDELKAGIQSGNAPVSDAMEAALDKAETSFKALDDINEDPPTP